MATELKYRLLLNGGVDQLVLNGGVDVLQLGSASDFILDDLDGAGATAGTNAAGYNIRLYPQGAGATAGAEDIRYATNVDLPSAAATAGAGTIVFEPGIITMDLDAAGATAGADAAGYNIRLYPHGAEASAGVGLVSLAFPLPSAAATAGAGTIVFEPGIITMDLDAAGATAGADAAGYNVAVYPHGAGATAGVTQYEWVLGLVSAAATAGTASFDYLIPVSPNPPTVAAVRAENFLSVTLSWASVRGATLYEIYRAEEYRGVQTLLASTASTTYADSSLAAGQSFIYSIRAVNEVMVVNGLRSLSVYVPGNTETITP
jgi:hypothetical protein